MSSYRDSHKNQGKKYEIMYSKNYDNFIWKLEQDILLNIFEGINKGINVMDFACGTGRITSFLENKFSNIDGVDISDDMLKIAKTKTTKVTYYLGDITGDLVLNKQYDLITTFRFFLNAEYSLRNSALKSLSKKMNTNGYLIFSNHGNKLSIRSIKIFLKKIIGIKKWNNELSNKEINDLLTSNGFNIEEIYPVSFLPVFLYKILSYNTIRYIETKLQKINCIKLFAVDIIYVARKK